MCSIFYSHTLFDHKAPIIDSKLIKIKEYKYFMKYKTTLLYSIFIYFKHYVMKNTSSATHTKC